MSERTVRARWLGGYRCDVDADGFVVPVDEPASVGGTGEGPQPTDLLLGSVASCFTLALAYSARKRGLELTGLDVEVTGAYDGPRFASIRIEARIGAPEAEIPRLLKSAERVCYVTNTLRQQPELEIVGEAVDASPPDI